MQERLQGLGAIAQDDAGFAPAGSRTRPKRSTKASMARAAMAAVEPLVELFLELGITSPEAESLLRSLYVHKARDWLVAQNGGVSPSDARVALVTGVHRNFVHQILSEPPAIAIARQRKGHRADKLLEAWHKQPSYLDNAGKPRDLPEKGPAPSFEALVSAHVPGAATGVVLAELDRAGVVQLLSDRRVRVRSRSMRLAGVNIGSLADLGNRAKELLETLRHNLRQPQDRLFAESLPPIELDANRLPVVREVINRRASAFLQSLEQELASERTRPIRDRRRKTARLSLTVLETKHFNRS